jgi:hypothetical protein
VQINEKREESIKSKNNLNLQMDTLKRKTNAGDSTKQMKIKKEEAR